MFGASWPRSTTLVRGVAGACGLVVLLAGCGKSSAPIASPPRSLDDLVAAALADARASGADASEIEALNDARDSGMVTAESYKAAQRRTLDCIAESGAMVTDVVETEQSTLPVLDATVRAGPGMSDDDLLATMDRCEARFSAALKGVYFQQPSSLEEWFARVEAHRAEVIACLRERGATIADDAPMDELFRVTEEVNLSTADEGHPINCMVEVGATDM